jgi:chemotaxis protein MotB
MRIKNQLFRIMILILCFTGMTGCIVSKKKYNDLLTKKVGLEGDKAICDEKLTTANADIERLSTANKNLLGENTRMDELLKQRESRLSTLESEKSDLDTK